MDILSYLLAKKYADMVLARKESPAITEVQFDLEGSVGLILNELRQHEWADKAAIENLTPLTEEGSVSLSNKQAFPFNDSVKSVSLTKRQPDTKYIVIYEIVSAQGNPGEIKISDKLVNGFKIEYTGSASSVVVKYAVIGGVIK